MIQFSMVTDSSAIYKYESELSCTDKGFDNLFLYLERLFSGNMLIDPLEIRYRSVLKAMRLSRIYKHVIHNHLHIILNVFLLNSDVK